MIKELIKPEIFEEEENVEAYDCEFCSPICDFTRYFYADEEQDDVLF